MHLTVTETGVVSKSLVRDIRKFIEGGFSQVQVKWESELHRHSFLEVVNDYLAEKYAEGKITNGKVVCDDRNNSSTAFQRGDFILDVHFTQKNCLKTTRLSYRVQPGEQPINC